MFVYTIQPVVKPVLYNRIDNRLYRVNRVLMFVSELVIVQTAHGRTTIRLGIDTLISNILVIILRNAVRRIRCLLDVFSCIQTVKPFRPLWPKFPRHVLELVLLQK